MLNFKKKPNSLTVSFISSFILFVYVNLSLADENLDQSRINMKSATQKLCVQSAKQTENLKELNSEEYCGCYAETVFSKMTDEELKDFFLNKNKESMQKKQMDAAVQCMTTGSSATQLVTKAFYKGCVETTVKSNNNMKISMPEYCGCVTDKMSTNLTQQDMQDFIKIGQDRTQLANTNISSKMMNFASQCLNQMVNK